MTFQGCRRRHGPALPEAGFRRRVQVEKAAWATDSHVGPYADGPVLAVFSRAAKARGPPAPADRLAAHEGQPRHPSQGEGADPPPVPLAPDHRCRLDRVLHHNLLPHGSLGRVRILAVLCRTRDRLLRHVLPLDLLQCRRDGRCHDSIERRRPDDLRRPEGRKGERPAHRRVGFGNRDDRSHLARDRRAIGFLGRIIAGALGAAWGIVTYLVVPVLIFEKIGPWAAVKRSGSLLRQTWGEAAGGYLSLGGIIVLLALPALLAPLLGFLLGGVI